MEKETTTEFFKQAFHFWFNDHEHIRSPFPKEIQSTLEILSKQGFEKWLSNLNPKAKDEINDEIIAEKFEEILFEIGLSLVTEDEAKTTILYPFLPRINDTTFVNGEENRVIKRTINQKGDSKFMEITCLKSSNQTEWSSEIELPV
jgi:hypothetical protein